MASPYSTAARVQAAENLKDMPEDMADMPEDMADMPEDMPEDMADMPEDMADMPEPTGGVDMGMLTTIAADFGKSEEEAMEMAPIIEAYMAAMPAPEMEEPMMEEPMMDVDAMMEEEMM